MGVRDTLHAAEKQTGSKRSLGLAVGACGVFLILAFALWIRFLNATPVLTIPQPTPPSPNAFDDFRAATKKIPPGQSKAAGDALWANLQVATYEPRKRKVPESERAELVRQYTPALERLREGLDHPYLEPPVRSFAHMLPHLAQFRDLSRVLRLEGQVRARRGDWPGAMASNLDSVQMGTKVVHGNSMIGGQVGIALQMIGRRDAWDITEHLSGPQARDAAKRLERIRQERSPYWRTLEEEKWSALAGMLEIMRRPDWHRHYLAFMLGAGQTGATADWGTLFHLTTTSKSTLINDYRAYMDRLIAQARVPYAKRSSPVALPVNSLVRMVVPVFENAYFTATSNEVASDLLMLFLALRAYRADHGRAPETLSALVPRYLKELPEDAFAPDGKFRYRIDRGRPLLYSVGPDAIDDRGRPVVNKRNSPDPAIRHQVEADSTGDIVAGVNVR